MFEASPKHFVSSWGSRTSVLNISHPVVSIYTHRHTFENFEILNFFAFDCHHWRGIEFLAPIFCAFGCTYLFLVGVQTYSGPFRSISKHQKYSRSDALLQTPFLATSQKNVFLYLFTPYAGLKTAFWGLSRELSGCLWSPKYAQKWPKRAPKVPESPN